MVWGGGRREEGEFGGPCPVDPLWGILPDSEQTSIIPAARPVDNEHAPRQTGGLYPGLYPPTSFPNV